MQFPILIEPVSGNGFRARGGEPLSIVCEGATREAALAKLKEQLENRLRAGAELVTLELPSDQHPLKEFVGMFKDDPGIARWKNSMAAYRRKVDKKPEQP